VTDWHHQTVDESLAQLQSDAASGLSEEEAARRHTELGPNELVETGGRGPWRVLWEQLSGAMVVLLIVAAVVSLALREYTHTAVILAIVVLNATLGSCTISGPKKRWRR
jgi:Ca2+-transporting ATPase